MNHQKKQVTPWTNREAIAHAYRFLVVSHQVIDKGDCCFGFGGGHEDVNEARLKERKAHLRGTIKVLRDAMPHADRTALSEQAAHLLLDHLSITQNSIIGLFWPIRSEIDSLALVDLLREKKARLALPAVVGATEMEFREWLPGEPMEDGGYGTFAPCKNAPIVKPDIVIVPLLAFDGQGNRLGYGAGFYDRYLAGLIATGHQARLIGLAFSLQKLDKVPVGLYDLPLDMIVTEAGILDFSGR